MLKKILRKFTPQKQVTLRIRRADEVQGGLLLGDTGTGKTQWLHQAIYQARADGRREPGVCYDPAGEFSQAHFRENTDAILNPLDERFPNWQLCWEIENSTDADLVAESFFTTHHISEQQKFFNRAAKGIFRTLLEARVSNEKMIKILKDEKLIDELVKGTELAHKIPEKAAPQRGAVLGTLADVADALKLLPAHDKGKKNLSLSHWAKNKGQGWLFLISTLDTRDALRPLQAAMINILMMRLMSVPSETGKIPPFWMIADELHSLHTLSALPTFVYESRKFGAKYLFGTQSKHQIIKNYGEEAKAILSPSKLKIFLRCNEPETAQWISDSIGNQERQMPFTSASVDAHNSGKVSTNFSNRLEKKVVVSKEQIMQLPNLHGYWCYDGKAVPFVLPYIDWQKKYPAFIPRKKKDPPPPQASSEPKPKNNPVIKPKPVKPVDPSAGASGTESDSDIDLNF
jgi:hypothetical protein